VRSIIDLVPDDAELKIVDPSEPVTINGHSFDVSNAGGLYHPVEKTAFIPSTATDPAGMIIHEATHAGLRDSVVSGVFDDAYNQARVKAGKIGNLPEHIQYGLSTPDEFVSAAVSDPRFQKFLQGGGNNKPWLSFLKGIKDAAGLKETRPGEANRAILDTVQATKPAAQTKEGVPVYSALPGVTGPAPAQNQPGLFSRAVSYVKTRAQRLALIIPNRDVIASYPHTGPLIKAIDAWRAEQGRLQGKVAQLNRRFYQLVKKNPGLTNEIDQIGRKLEAGQQPRTMSPEVIEWLRIANSGLYREIGDMMRAGKYEVELPDGTRRPFIGAPQGVIPFSRGTMRPDVAHVLAGQIYTDATKQRLTPAAQKLFAEGRQTIDQNTGRPVFSQPSDLEAWARQYKMEQQRRGPVKTSLEKARVLKYPSFFNSYTPQAMLNTLTHQATEIARLNAFGQKIGGKEDLIDKTIAKINDDLSMTGGQRKAAIAAVESLKNNVYGLNVRGTTEKIARGASSAGFAGSPRTSGKIGLGMLANSFAYRGIGRTLLGIYDRVFKPGQSMDELRRLGLSSNKILNLGDDPYTVATATSKAQNLFTGVLNLAGHAFAQDLGKSVTARASRSWLEDYAIKRLQRDPGLTNSETRKIAQDIQRRGMNPKDFATGNVSQELRDQYVRESVNDFQTAYRPEDYPAWTSGKLGFAFQFGHWSYAAARAITREIVLPMVKAGNEGDWTLASRYAMQLVGTAAVSAGASEALRKFQELFGAQSGVATFGEIWKAFVTGNPEAAHMVLSRLGQDIIGSPVIGLFGDVGNLVSMGLKGRADTVHSFNPAQPAAVSFVENFFTVINKLSQEGWHLSNRQIGQALGTFFSGGRAAVDLAHTLGIPLPWHSEDIGHRESNFVKSRLDVFYDLHPEWDKRPKGGSFAGNTHTPYLQNLNDALVAGDVAGAKRIIRDMRVELKLDPKTLATSLRESVDSHRPIPQGKAGPAFAQWAKRTLTPDEFARTKAIDNKYDRTALASGALTREPKE